MAAEAAISSVVQILGDLLIQKVSFLKGVEGNVQWVKDELKRMQSFLKDAAEKQANDESICNWISDIRQVAQDAEDAIEMFILRVENATRRRGLLTKCASFPNRLRHLYEVGKEIEAIRKRLQEIESSRLRYGIQDLGKGVQSTKRSEEVERQRRVAPWQDDKDVVALEEDVKLLLQEAILDERGFGLSVATIVGMGGIGKSTLARKIYNHAVVAARFKCRAWVVVSSQFTAEDVMKQIMLQLQISLPDDKVKDLESMEDKLRREEVLQEMLHQHLVGKRYFIVLDDVWEHTHWQSLERAFPDKDTGSRLLLTSRNRFTTKYIQYDHQMKSLDIDESWKLFLKKALVDKIDGKCPEDLKDIGEKILEKCNGLPLAISVVGGQLAKQTQTRSEWQKVLDGINSHLGRSESNVSAILELSYNNLPPQLKPCFLSLAFFKQDATIRAEKLVDMWIAQGLVSHKVGRGGEGTLEDIARGYLDELINRNMVQVRDVRIDDRAKTCHIHDLIRELSIRKAGEEINFEILREEGNSQPSHKPRHRAMYCIGTVFIDSTDKNKYLRSLFVHGPDRYMDIPSSSYWKSFELLRVLDMEGCTFEKLPDAFGALIGLRYLGLRNTRILKLPRSLHKLKNLEVIDLWGSNIGEIPSSVGKMYSLRHLYIYAMWCKLPLKGSTLKNLQTLSYIFSIDEAALEQVKKFTSLRKLGIGVNEFRRPNASKLFSSLAVLENLVCLYLSGCGSLNMDGLGTLHHITQLKLRDWISRLPSADNFPPNLSYLTLWNTNLEEDPMPVLEKLPRLLHLKLKAYVYKGDEMSITRDGFPSLKGLHYKESWKLRIVKVEEGAMPELKRFQVERSPHLRIETLSEHVRSAITYIH